LRIATVFGLMLVGWGIAASSPAHAEKYPKRETIQVGLIDRTFFPQPVFVAIQNGYFADEGLNANIRFIRSGEGQAAGLIKGDLNFVLSSTEGIIQNVEHGGPLRMIAANSGKLSHFIITQKKFTKVEDLKGATVGILTMTEGSFFNWQEIAQKHGLKFPEDYKVLETAGAGARHRLLLEGKIDVGLHLCRRGRRLQQSRRGVRVCAGLAVHRLQRQR
jgi:NitT/TauT family transport system substrate-binding protein